MEDIYKLMNDINLIEQFRLSNEALSSNNAMHYSFLVKPSTISG